MNIKRGFIVLTAGVLFLSGCNSSASDIETSDSEGLLTEVTTEAGLQEQASYDSYDIFKGIEKDESPLSTVNVKQFRPSLLCYGDGDVYFMWNGTVYRHDGENTEPLFQKNAYSLNYRDGKLYFVVNDEYDLTGIDFVDVEGILYCYDLEKKTMEAVSDYPISQPVITEDGIFYVKFAREGDDFTTGVYGLDEQTGESQRLYDGVSYAEYNGYHLEYEWNEAGEIALFCKGEERLLLKDIHPYWSFIDGDFLYFLDGPNGVLNRLSLLTGELITLQPCDFYQNGEVVEEAEERFHCSDFIAFKDGIYFIDYRSSLCRFNEKEQTFTRLSCEYNFIYIFASGENIYAVGWDNDAQELNPIKPPRSFVKLNIEGDIAEIEKLAGYNSIYDEGGAI